VNLLKPSPPAPLPASVTDGATPGDALGGHVVRAVAVILVADALAPVATGTHGAYANLVSEAGSGAARNEPTTAAFVVVEDLVGVKLE